MRLVVFYFPSGMKLQRLKKGFCIYEFNGPNQVPSSYLSADYFNFHPSTLNRPARSSPPDQAHLQEKEINESAKQRITRPLISLLSYDLVSNS